MNEKKSNSPQKKMGRPKADKYGAMIWVSADILDAVQAYIKQLKEKKQSENESKCK